MKKEWEYMISPTEIYFTKDFRFPLNAVMQITLDRAPSGTIQIVAGAALIFLALAIGGFDLSPTLLFIFIAGLGLIGWGIYTGRAYQVGFVILKDPKWYEKTFVSVLKTHSRTEAEKKLEELHDELAKNGREKVRIVRLI
ncbi:hypothetical protein [Nitratifractor sp.]|uniref:hypothetical protein n=1 Tax=Nitratifractor sp. TaxID=2268144 RepID=UPI0025F9171B|nr:hypothetical protein [Nitratifractor sp.]